jgi:hypothetical protein
MDYLDCLGATFFYLHLDEKTSGSGMDEVDAFGLSQTLRLHIDILKTRFVKFAPNIAKAGMTKILIGYDKLRVILSL